MLASVVLGSQSWACLALLHLDATVRRTCHGDPVGFRRMADMLSRPSFYLPKNSVLDSKLLILPFGGIFPSYVHSLLKHLNHSSVKMILLGFSPVLGL